MRVTVGLACVALAAGVLSGCAAPGPRADGRLSVVAGESPWGSIAAAVGGRHVAVTSLISTPGSDPHEYVASAPAAASVATADVVVENGLGYDAFLDHLVATGGTHERVVVNAASVLGVSGTEANPHLFYAVERVGTVAEAIASAYSKVDPTHQRDYETSLRSFLDSLGPLNAQVTALRAAHGGEGVAQTERLAGDLLEEAGLIPIGPEGFSRAIEEGREPTAADRHALEVVLATHRVVALVVSSGPQNTSVREVIALSKSNGIGVVTMSELVVPQGASYVSWMRAQVGALATVVGGAR